LSFRPIIPATNCPEVGYCGQPLNCALHLRSSGGLFGWHSAHHLDLGGERLRMVRLEGCWWFLMGHWWPFQYPPGIQNTVPWDPKHCPLVSKYCAPFQSLWSGACYVFMCVCVCVCVWGGGGCECVCKHICVCLDNTALSI